MIAQQESGITFRTGKQRWLGVALLAVAVISLVLGLIAFRDPLTEPDGWLPYALSGLFLIAACYALIPYRAAGPALPQLQPVHVGALLVVFLIAAFMRLYRLDVLPFGTWIDEADIGIIARRIVENPDYRPLMVEGLVQPLHFYLYVSLFFRMFGISIEAVRLATITLGLGTVGLAFLTGREAYGSRFGLILAFLFAISRWHTTFSRFGVYTISVPFFELLVMWLLLRARRTGQPHEFALAGLALGLSVNFYIAARLLVATFGVYILHWLIRRNAGHPAGAAISFRTLAGGLAAFAIGACFAAAPIIQFAIQYPQLYWGRSTQVSIFVQRDQPDLWKAIASNTSKHLLMFNYKGDNNGRHNLPGEPMLDPITGVFFVVGAVLTITRPRHPLSFLFTVSFFINLMGGILSLDFEAPQGSRAFGAVTAALYFAAVAVETLFRAAQTRNMPVVLQRTIMAAATAGLAGYAVYYNAETFFVRQANNDRAWLEYGGIQASAAERMLEADPEVTGLYSSVFLGNHMAIQFLAPSAANSTILIPPNGLPLRESGERPAGIFVDPDNEWIVAEARKFYPNARYTTDTTPSGNPALYSIFLSPEDSQRLHGVSAAYWVGEAAQGNPALVREQTALKAAWPQDAPLAAPFVTQWTATLYAPKYADYQLALRSPATATLWLDGRSLGTGTGEQTFTVSLAEGDHALMIEAASGEGTLELVWRELDGSGDPVGEFSSIPEVSVYLPSLVPVHGLQGAYYEGDGIGATPAFKRIDAFIDMYVHIIPLGRPYTVEWTGQIEIPEDGEWAFGLRINGLAEVYIDDQLAVNATEPQNELKGPPLQLTAGPHSIRIVFHDVYGGSRIHLYWYPPGEEPQIVPREALLPYP